MNFLCNFGATCCREADERIQRCGSIGSFGSRPIEGAIMARTQTPCSWFNNEYTEDSFSEGDENGCLNSDLCFGNNIVPLKLKYSWIYFDFQIKIKRSFFFQFSLKASYFWEKNH